MVNVRAREMATLRSKENDGIIEQLSDRSIASKTCILSYAMYSMGILDTLQHRKVTLSSQPSISLDSSSQKV
jgi:hypothetical protein